jgi:myo-inositol-1(or 4)-monophosphatase
MMSDAEQAMSAVLRAARPLDGVHGAEGGLHGRAIRTWLVDPLCGTRNFATKKPVVAVNLALRVEPDVAAADAGTHSTLLDLVRRHFLTA